MASSITITTLIIWFVLTARGGQTSSLSDVAFLIGAGAFFGAPGACLIVGVIEKEPSLRDSKLVIIGFSFAWGILAVACASTWLAYIASC
jgi:hypothetical protein